MTHNVRLVPDHWGKKRFRSRTLSQGMQLQIAVVTRRIETKRDSAFYEITLILVYSLAGRE